MSLRTLFLLAIFFTVVTGVASADDGDPSAPIPGIVDLNPKNFESYVGQDSGALIEFYAPWCGHCKKLIPELVQVGAVIKDDPSQKAMVGKFNAEKHKDFAKQFGLSQYPTLVYFAPQSDKGETFNAPRDAKSILAFLSRKLKITLELPPEPYVHSIVAVVNHTNFEQVVYDPTKHVLVKFYATWCAHSKKMAPTYEQLAHIYRPEAEDVVIAQMDSDEMFNKRLANRIGARGYPNIKLFPKGENKLDSVVDYNGNRELDSFVAFMNQFAGTRRDVNGLLLPEVGVVEPLTEALKAYISAPAEETHEAKQKVVDAVKSSTDSKYASYYEQIADKVFSSGGGNYVKKELPRLTKLLEGKVNAARRDPMTIKKNILASLA